MEYYISKNSERRGPLSIEQIIDEYRDGLLTKDDLIWYHGLEEWQSLGDFHRGKVPVSKPKASDYFSFDDYTQTIAELTIPLRKIISVGNGQLDPKDYIAGELFELGV